MVLSIEPFSRTPSPQVLGAPSTPRPQVEKPTCLDSLVDSPRICIVPLPSCAVIDERSRSYKNTSVCLQSHFCSFACKRPFLRSQVPPFRPRGWLDWLAATIDVVNVQVVLSSRPDREAFGPSACAVSTGHSHPISPMQIAPSARYSDKRMDVDRCRVPSTLPIFLSFSGGCTPRHSSVSAVLACWRSSRFE